jgi:hypothetical protein
LTAVIDAYVDGVLTPQLEAMGGGEYPAILAMVTADVRTRLAGLLCRWADKRTRETLLLVGREEGQSYAPHSAPDDVRALVVMALRNSLLEELSTTCSRLLPTGHMLIADARMREITGEAIQFWRRIPLLTACTMVAQPEGDPFGHLAQTYPHAWHVLSALATTAARTVRFAACAAPPPALPAEPDHAVHGSRVHIGASGADPNFDPQLLALLASLGDGQLEMLAVPSWKHLTRNTDKLYHVLDIALGHGRTVVTPNYLLSPTYACVRARLLKPAHHNSEIAGKLRKHDGLEPEHRAALEEVIRHRLLD